MLRTLLIAGFYALVIGPAALIGFPVTFIRGNANFLYRMAMWIVRTGIRIGGIRVEIRGLEHLDSAGTYIYMSNHVSNLDPPILIPAIPRRTSVLVKKEVFRIPILSRAMHLAELVPVDRSNRDAAVESIRKAAEVLRHGINMTIFAEGTRSPDGRLTTFKKGPFYLAEESGVWIVPTAIYGTETMMPKGSVRIQKGIATVVFGTPIDPKQFALREDLMRAVHDAVAAELPERMQPQA